MSKFCIDKRVTIATPQGLHFAIAEKGKQWKNGELILVYFMEGTKAQQDYIIAVARELLQYAHLYLEVTNDAETSDIRISLQQGAGSWSYLGTDNLLIPKNEATMNFGWELDPATILHEFMHAFCGAGHEHQHPQVAIKWNVERIMADTGWSRQQVIEQIVIRYTIEQIIGDTYDPESINHYFFLKEWTLDGKEMKQNTKLSAGDKRLLAKLYPFPAKPETPEAEKMVNAGKIWNSYFSLIRIDVPSYQRLAKELQLDTTLLKTKAMLVNAIADKLGITEWK